MIVFGKAISFSKISLSLLVLSQHRVCSTLGQSRDIEPTRIRSICEEYIGFLYNIVDRAKQTYLSGHLALVLSSLHLQYGTTPVEIAKSTTIRIIGSPQPFFCAMS